MAFLRIYGFFLVYFAVVFSVHATDTCVKQSACVCLFPNGTGIDLTPAAAANFSSADTYNYVATGSAKYVMATYYYHPCYDVKLSDLINVKVPLANNTCTDPSSICRHVNTMMLVNETLKTFKLDDGVLDFMGKSSVSIFSDQGDSIVYANGPSQTTVLLRCAQITENQLEVYSTVDPRNVILAFYSPDACLKQIEASGRSIGSTLLIIFLSFVIFYLVLGICTKKFLMGATGIEVIPNLGFWSELPNLVRDGWLFMTNGFKLPARASGQTVSPDPNSYDSI